MAQTDERTASAAIGILEYRTHNFSVLLARSLDLLTSHKLTPLIPYGLKRGSQSPTTKIILDDKGYPTSGYIPQPFCTSTLDRLYRSWRALRSSPQLPRLWDNQPSRRFT